MIEGGTDNTEAKITHRQAIANKSHPTEPRGLYILVILALVVSVSAMAESIWLHSKSNSISSRMESLQNQVSDLSNTIYSLKVDILALRYASQKGSVDLTIPAIQDIGDGFMAAHLSVEQHLTGVKVKGRIINSTALDHENIKFRIALAEETKEFIINRISSGNSTGFAVYIPGVPIDKTRYGTIQYIESGGVYFKAR